MTRRTMRAALTLVGGMVVALVALPVAPAHARPLPEDDNVNVYAGATYTIDPLANDDTSLLSTGALYLCGFTNNKPGQLYVEETDDDRLLVETNPQSTGSITFTYGACQGNERDTARVTLQLNSLAELSAAKKRTARGKVVFANVNNVAVTVRWGSTTSGNADGARVVPPRGSLTVSTRRSRIYWVGYLRDGDAVVPAGDGVIRGIERPRRKR